MLIWTRESVDGEFESVGKTLARRPKKVPHTKKSHKVKLLHGWIAPYAILQVTCIVVMQLLYGCTLE